MLTTFLYFIFIILYYLCPLIPVSIKGITGIIFIIISGTKTGIKGSLPTAFLLIVLQATNYILFDKNTSLQPHTVNFIIGSLVFLSAAVYLGLEIDSRKRLEKDLKENLSLLGSLMSTLPTPVSFKDLNFRYTGCNPAYEEYFGLSEQDIKGKTAHELFEPEVADICLELDVDLLDNKIRQSREVGFLSNDGNQKFFIFTKALLTDGKGNATGTVSVFLDTTDQKEHEKLKRSMEEEKLIIDEMQKYDRLKTEFFSNISHELRIPLNVIFCAVQLMEMNLSGRKREVKPEFFKKNISTIRQNSLRLLRLVNNLIDMTKIDAQAFEIKLRNLDIVNVVKEITLSVDDYIATKGLRLVFHTDTDKKIMAFDEEKIERILLNLLSNAIKFSPPGAAIYVDLTDRGNTISIKVRDMGIGIPIERQQDIFQRFYQISPLHTRLREGSGIGLNLVKSLIEMHRGTITVESEYGNGSAFIVELPCSVLPKEKTEKGESKGRQSRIDNIKLEFSDIYLGNNTCLHLE